MVISHITVSLKEFNLNPYILGASADGEPQGLLLASHGVSIFFVLSGFLITYLLLAEKDIQNISIKKFYLRRILRIWPLYYLYLAICIIVILSIGTGLNLRSLIFYVFYAANIPFVLGISLPFLGHYWSLGVEEQFYLFWPWLVKKVKYLLPITIGLTVFLISLKLAVHMLYPHSVLEYFLQITRFQCMMIGALGAMLYKKEKLWFLKIADNKITQSLSWLVLFLLAINRFHLSTVFDDELISVTAILLIIGQIRINNRLISLDIKPLAFLGRISYGIYIIHPLVLFCFEKVLGNAHTYAPIKYFIVYSGVMFITIFAAYFSYLYVEKPFLILKKKYQVVKSSYSKNSGD